MQFLHDWGANLASKEQKPLWGFEIKQGCAVFLIIFC